MALYSRLFQFLERQRLEDFLTEALVDLLEKLGRFDREQMLAFIEKVLLRTSISSKSGLIERLRAAPRLEWRTQVSIPGGRPDIILYDAQGPLLLVENKIGAGYTVRQMVEIGEDDDGKIENPQEEKPWLEQLVRYDLWLSAQSAHSGLILLTQWTSPPEGFIEANGKYKTPLRAVCRWREVHQWLDSYAKTKGDTLEAALASDLASFLEEQGMSAQITIEDLTATRLFLTRSFQRIESLMETLGAEVMAILDEVNSQAKSASEYKMARTQKRGQFTSEFQPLVLWDWCVREGRHIAWGLRFPGDYKAGWAGHPFARTEPKVDEIFVYVGTDDFKEAPIDVSKAGRFAEKGWKFFDEDQFGMKALSMYQLLGGQRDFTEALLAWFRETVREAIEILEAGSL